MCFFVFLFIARSLTLLCPLFPIIKYYAPTFQKVVNEDLRTELLFGRQKTYRKLSYIKIEYLASKGHIMRLEGYRITYKSYIFDCKYLTF